MGSTPKQPKQRKIRSLLDSTGLPVGSAPLGESEAQRRRRAAQLQQLQQSGREGTILTDTLG